MASIGSSTSRKELTSRTPSRAKKLAGQLIHSINNVYGSLIQAGRNEEASRIRDMTNKLKRSGRGLGVNPMARARELQKVVDDVTRSGQLTEAKALQARSRDMAQAISLLGGLERDEFSRELASEAASERQQKAFQQPKNQPDLRVRRQPASTPVLPRRRPRLRDRASRTPLRRTPVMGVTGTQRTIMGSGAGRGTVDIAGETVPRRGVVGFNVFDPVTRRSRFERTDSGGFASSVPSAPAPSNVRPSLTGRQPSLAQTTPTPTSGQGSFLGGTQFNISGAPVPNAPNFQRGGSAINVSPSRGADFITGRSSSDILRGRRTGRSQFFWNPTTRKMTGIGPSRNNRSFTITGRI